MVYIYIFAMALVTYLIRMLPLTIFKEKIKNPFVQSILYYIPYACLTAMTIPGIFTATTHVVSGISAFVIGVLVSLKTKSLTLVALASATAVLICEIII